MLDFRTDTTALRTISNIAALSTAGGTIYFHINENIDGDDWSGESTIIKFDNFRVYLNKISSSVNLFIEHIGSVSNGWWVSASLTNAQHQIAFTYDFSAGVPADPVIVVDGVTDIVELSAPDGAYAIGAQPMLIGGESETAVTNPCRVPLGEIAVFVGTKLTKAQMIQLTSSKVMRMPLQYSTCTHYWAMDEIPNGVAYAVAGNQINPNGDVLTPWNTETPHWSKINAQDGVSIYAEPNDDYETEQFDCTTDTIPANRKVGAFLMDMYAKRAKRDSGPILSVWLGCNGTTAAQFAGLGTSFGWVPTMYFYVFGTQAHLDALQLYLATRSLNSDDEISVDQVKMTPYYIWNRILDYKSGVYLVGISEAVGVANNYLSYS